MTSYTGIIVSARNSFKVNHVYLFHIYTCILLYVHVYFYHAMKKKYMIMSRHPKSGQNQNIRIANESFENVERFKYLGTSLTNQNDIRDEIWNRLSSGNACYHSVKNVLFSRLV
jgi:hypothetical protein